MKLAHGEAIVLFPDQHEGASTSSREFVRCVSGKLKEKADAFPRVMESAEFQDAMFPWFEPGRAPENALEMDGLLSKPRVRERIGALKVRYLVSMALSGSADGFPGMLCGAGPGAAGCFGVAWEDRASRLRAIVWDLETGRDTGELSVSSSGRSLAFGVVIPIVFTAYTEEDACEALASGLAEFLGNGTGTGSRD